MKTQNPWMGRARGSAGNMTSSKVYDKNVMRAKAFEVNNPKTAAQTTEREFFAQCQKLSNDISEEQLRTLFGVKPKSKSRRNALLSQLLSMYVYYNGNKTFEPTKEFSLGNGKKIQTPLAEGASYDEDFSDYFGALQDSSEIPSNASLVLVYFDNDIEKLGIAKSDHTLEEAMGLTIGEVFEVTSTAIYGYVTIENEGGYVYDKSFGSFIIKTRAEKKTTSQPSN